jgi:excisionase family DNA binding protein
MPQAKTLSVPEAAAALGVGRNAAYAAVKRGQIPAIRIGRLLRVPVIALERMLKQGGPELSPSEDDDLDR